MKRDDEPELQPRLVSLDAYRGYTAQVADACVIIPTVNPGTVTPHAEAFQAVVWHLLVSHPSVKLSQTKWESAQAGVAPSSSIETA